MSSYRPPHRRNVWSNRETEQRDAARKAEEEQKRRMEMNTTNFPNLSTARPTTAVNGNQYARLAERWAVDEEVDRRMAEYKRLQEEADRRDAERFAARHAQRTRYARHDEEYDQEDLAPTPSAPSEDMGWTEVKRKSRKPKRELTVEEMDELDRKRQEEANTEFNAHLFDSNRHDHDRV